MGNKLPPKRGSFKQYTIIISQLCRSQARVWCNHVFC